MVNVCQTLLVNSCEDRWSEHENKMKFRSCQINPEQVRLLLFKECDWRGRKLLFDSSAIQKVAAGKDGKPDVRQTENVPSIVEVSDGFHYVYKGPASDASVLGEMIFGAVAMNYKSVSLKIHIMDEPKRLMCTKVFCVPSTRRVSRAERRNAERPEATSMNLRNGSKPLSVPSLREEGVSLSFSLDRGDSGYYGDFSPYSSVGSTIDYFSMFDTWNGNNSQEDFYTFQSPSGRKLSTSSNGSWQRRTFQNIATRFDLGNQSSNLLLVPTPTVRTTSFDSQMHSNSSASTSDSFSSCGSLMLRRNKLGLALLITVTDSAEMDLVRRCVEHSPQLQALECRLRLATLAAGVGGSFVSTLYKATEDAARWLTDLIYGPRLQPMWLNLVTSEPRASSKLAETLLSDLCSVLSVGDTKGTNFFISTLLTHVLTYHLGWVTTISPYDTVECQKQSKPTERPYNALWAQLGDLCGAIGHPPRVARTVISGTANSQFINRLLLVLTYFVRCGAVKRQDFNHNIETTVISLNEPKCKSSDSDEISVIVNSDSASTVNTQVFNALVCDSVSTLASQATLRKTSTLANLSEKLSSSSELFEARERPTSTLRRNPTLMLSLKASSDSSINSSLSDDSDVEQKVVFVLGDNDKLVGLKNKSNGGKSVKKSSKVQIEPIKLDNEDLCPKEGCDNVQNPESPSKCCGQTLQHSKPIKHSGFKFEFDKYPQIVTNYMKSKNLEILDRHYIGKPGNLKLDNFQFDPTIVPSIQEERCETCVKCQMMESLLQTPTNASEMEYMNDIPRQLEPQHATESIVQESKIREMSPKTFVRRRKENTVIVNNSKPNEEARRRISREKETDKVVEVKQVLQFPVPPLSRKSETAELPSGFDGSLLGGVTDHYVPDLILQGTLARPNEWEKDLRRDLDLTSYINKTLESPLQAVAILGDTNTWEVRVVGRECGSGGMSSLVGAMLDALPAMWRAKVPAHHCLSFLEGKLREFCVLSKTLADMLMTTDFCDINTLTKSLNIDVNDVPLLLAVATTHTPQVAARYGISYR